MIKTAAELKGSVHFVLADFIHLRFFYRSQHVSYPCSITHSLCPNWNRRSESALPLLNRRCETSIMMSPNGILKLVAGLSISVCGVLKAKELTVICLAATFCWKCLLVPNQKSCFFILFSNVLFLPLGRFIKSTIDTGLNKCMTPMALWRQSELYFLKSA